MFATSSTQVRLNLERPLYRRSNRATVRPVRAISTPFKQREAAKSISIDKVPSLDFSFWQFYLKSLEHKPLLTKAFTNFFLTVVSDSVAQLIGGIIGYSLFRCVRLGLYAATIGAVSGHYWHKWLDCSCFPREPTAWKTVGSKIALDQMIFTPLMTGLFFAFLKAVEGQPHMILPFISEKLGSTLLVGYTVWPAVNIITFRYIPQDLRILFGSAIGLFWSIYLSLSCVNNAAVTPAAALELSDMIEIAL